VQRKNGQFPRRISQLAANTGKALRLNVIHTRLLITDLGCIHFIHIHTHTHVHAHTLHALKKPSSMRTYNWVCLCACVLCVRACLRVWYVCLLCECLCLYMYMYAYTTLHRAQAQAQCGDGDCLENFLLALLVKDARRLFPLCSSLP